MSPSNDRRRVKGRRNKGPAVVIPLDVLEHPAVTTLTNAQFRELVLLASQYRGRHNGALGLTAEQAIAAGIGSKNTHYEALHVLEERGLIEQTYPASRVPPRPAMYGLTWWSIDDTEYTYARAAPRTWRKWK